MAQIVTPARMLPCVWSAQQKPEIFFIELVVSGTAQLPDWPPWRTRTKPPGHSRSANWAVGSKS